MDEPAYYTPVEVAEKFGVTRQAVYRWISSGKLRAVRLGDTEVVRIPQSALDAFVRPIVSAEASEDAEE